MKLIELLVEQVPNKMFLDQQYKDHLGETEPWGEVIKQIPPGSTYLYDIYTDPSEDYRALQGLDYSNHPEFRVWLTPDNRLVILDLLEWDTELDRDDIVYFYLDVPRSELEKHLVPFKGVVSQTSQAMH